jgi:hypothetical protein
VQIHTRVWNYNKMSGGIGDGGVVVDDDEDRCRVLQDPSLPFLLCGGDDGVGAVEMEAARRGGRAPPWMCMEMVVSPLASPPLYRL